MKEENIREANIRHGFSEELVGQSAVVIKGLEKKICALEDTVASIEKKLNSAKQVIGHQKEKAEPALRQKRRIAMKLLTCVMELDDDVALPGKQRPVSASRALEEAPIAPSKNTGLSLSKYIFSQSYRKNTAVPSFEDSNGDDVEVISAPPNPVAAGLKSHTDHSTQITPAFGLFQSVVLITDLSSPLSS